MILEKIESTGIKLAVVPNGLQITGEITDQQLEYLRSNKSTLMATLRLRGIAEKRGHDLNDLLRWYKDDLPNLAAMSDEDFLFVVSEYLDNLDRYSPSNRPHCVRCINCLHFAQSDHPHLGRCAANVPPPNCGLFWDNDRRGCDKFTESTQEAAACLQRQTAHGC